jgi:hypothetical protein
MLSTLISYKSSIFVTFVLCKTATFTMILDAEIPSEVWDTTTTSSVHGASQSPGATTADQYNNTNTEIGQLCAQLNTAADHYNNTHVEIGQLCEQLNNANQ